MLRTIAHVLLTAAVLASAVAATAFGARGLLANGTQPEVVQVRLDGPAVPAIAPDELYRQGEITVAIGARLSPRHSLGAHGPIMDALEARLGCPIRVVQRRTYAEVNDLLVSGEASFGFVCGGAYVDAEARGLVPIAAPVVGGSRNYNALIIVADDDAAASFDDLRGRSFAFTDPRSTAGCLYPSFILAQRDLLPEQFFQRVIWTGGHEASVEAVANRLVGGAAVDSLTYDYLRARDPALVSRTRVLQVSPPFGTQPVVASPLVDAEARERFVLALLALHEAPDGRAALAQLAVDRYERASPEDYRMVRTIRETTRRLQER